jgi:hypothetical protein
MSLFVLKYPVDKYVVLFKEREIFVKCYGALERTLNRKKIIISGPGDNKSGPKIIILGPEIIIIFFCSVSAKGLHNMQIAEVGYR